jgi:hypothetical protein
MTTRTPCYDPLALLAADHRRTLLAEAAAHRQASAARAGRRSRQLRLRRSWACPGPIREAAA